MPILLLLRLQRVQLPVRVTDPEEVRQVSMLVATGLIQAEFEAIRTFEPGTLSGMWQR